MSTTWLTPSIQRISREILIRRVQQQPSSNVNASGCYATQPCPWGCTLPNSGLKSSRTQHGGSNWPIREDVLDCHITHLFFTDINLHKLFPFHFSTKMSSWLSSNLTGSLSSISNLTGQISSFTREILTEGAEEVSGKIYH